MEKELIPYKQALELKELGFNISCYERYYNGELQVDYGEWNGHSIEHIVSAPLYQQSFRWFREKYDYIGFIYQPNETGYWAYSLEDKAKYDTYEEAELECLKKLIEIVKEQK